MLRQTEALPERHLVLRSRIVVFGLLASALLLRYSHDETAGRDLHYFRKIRPVADHTGRWRFGHSSRGCRWHGRSRSGGGRGHGPDVPIHGGTDRARYLAKPRGDPRAGFQRQQPQIQEVDPLVCAQMIQYRSIRALAPPHSAERADIEIVDRKNKIVAAECGLPLAELRDLPATPLAVQKGWRDDRDQERGLLDGLLDFLRPVRAGRDRRHVLEDLNLR